MNVFAQVFGPLFTWPFLLFKKKPEEPQPAPVVEVPPSLWRFVDVLGHDLPEQPVDKIVLVNDKKVRTLLTKHLKIKHPLMGGCMVGLTEKSWPYHESAETVPWAETAEILNHIHRDHFKQVALFKPIRRTVIEIAQREVDVKGVRNLMTDEMKCFKDGHTRCVIPGDIIRITVGTLEWEHLSDAHPPKNPFNFGKCR